MDKIKILVDFDSDKSVVDEILDKKVFDIHKTRLRATGVNTAHNLTEYDAIILNYKKNHHCQRMRIDQLKKYLLRENKLLIFFLNSLVGDVNDANLKLMGYLFGEYKEILDNIIRVNNEGRKYLLSSEGKKSFISKYLDSDSKNWKIAFLESKTGLTIPLAINTDEESIAVVLKHENINSKALLIPWIPESEKVLWESISEYLVSIKQDYENIDEWVGLYSFPKLDETKEQIEKLDENIDSLEKQKYEFISHKQKFERIRNVLLYHSGDLLKDVCKEVFNELGLKTVDGKQGREDLVFIYNNEHFLIEVKGTEKSASKTHIRQLDSHLTEYRGENEVPVKGILLINTWRKLPLEERGTEDKPIFPPDIMNLVNLSDIALVTTQQLFVMFCEHLGKNFNVDNIVKKVKKTKGVFEGFEDINYYKKKESG